jgi:tetratricopeptide (TPR) repeat protein
MSKRSRTPLLHELYHQYLVDQNSETFCRGVARRYTIGTLERLSGAGDRMARRAAILALGALGDYSSNTAMGRALQDADRGVRILADNAIRQLWCRCGTPSQRKRLDSAVELNGARRFQEAIDATTRLIAEAPSLAEAWNQRALALFNLGRFAESIRDCTQTLEINPYHFGAATGMAQSYMQTNNRAKALESFRRALKLNPSLEGVRAHVLYLQRTLKSQE